MSNPRQRTIILAVLAIAGIWIFAVAGYYITQSLR